jgi:hypothetical protein
MSSNSFDLSQIDSISSISPVLNLHVIFESLIDQSAEYSLIHGVNSFNLLQLLIDF